MTRMFAALAGIAMVLAPGAAAATDLALVVANQSYEGRKALDAGPAAAGLASDLKARGWSVFAVEDGSADQMWDAALTLRRAMQRSPEPDRVIIAVTGLMAHGATGGWLLSDAPGRANMLNVGGRGLSLNALAAIAGFAPGQAVLLIGTPGEAAVLGIGLNPGPGDVALPQGVSAVLGPMDGLRDWTRDVLLQPGTSYDEAFRSLPDGARKDGFSSRRQGFAAAGVATPVGPMGEMAYWNAARDIGTRDALEAYLRRYPQGVFAGEARTRIAAMTRDPETLARAAEQALGLDRDARRQIQRNLDLLGFDPRGIDGVFGRGSRAAIAAWQADQGYAANGYLNGPQVQELQRQADRRAAELAREAKLRREAEEHADRQYWQRIGRDEASLRRYLDRYPDGIFAEDAQARLDLILQDRRARAEARERRAWDKARDRNTIAAYRDFLGKFPHGSFAGEARDRIAELQAEADNAAAIEQLKKVEAQVVPNKGARLIVEQILAARGFKPGPADGVFTAETRRALRRFQREQGLTVSGFVTQRTMVVLMLTR